MNVKNIVKNTIKFIFVEVCYGLIISLIGIGQKVVSTIATQGAASSEVQRLKGETTLAVTEVLKNYNNSINLVTCGLIAAVVILMAYSAYKYVDKTFIKKEI